MTRQNASLSPPDLCAPLDFAIAAALKEESLSMPLTPYLGTLPIPPIARPDSKGRLKMIMVPATAQLHPELPAATNVWVYRAEGSAMDGTQVPVGPTIEVNQGVEAHVEWKNALFGADGQPAKHPVVAVQDLPEHVKFQSSGEVHCSENLSGFTLGNHDHSAAELPPWAVVHLHGGRTEANSDGWPENAIYPGQVQRDTYTNKQPGTLLWYHDHAMSFTRLNVYAGLAGFYVIRDPREKELGLPRGSHDYELLLLLQDRALTCDGDHPGIDAGQLLHKTGTAGQDTVPNHADVSSAPMEFFGPLTMVNGCIWPRHTVKAGVYRLRLLNGCNARTYRLRFTDGDNNLVDVPMQMIGSDGGLLAKPFDLNDQNRPESERGSITLAPAERIDVLVDFSGLRGSVELRNFAGSPFNGADADPSNPLADFLTYPQVMRFDIHGKTCKHQLLDSNQELRASATSWDYATVQGVANVERLLALVEDDAGVLQLMECASLKDSEGNPRLWDGTSPLPITQLALQQRGDAQAKLYCLLPGMFSDPVRYLARDGDVEVWKIINLSADTHPVHIHLIQFKMIARDPYSGVQRLPEPLPPAPGGGYEIHFDASTPAVVLDEAERGWKDTIRVNPRELMVIAVPFRDYARDDTTPQSGLPIGMTGRYVYHCHILEHEDHEMMRPYVVMPPQVVEHMRHKMSNMMHAGAGTTPDTNVTPYDGWYMDPNLCCCDPDSSTPHS